MLGGAAALLVLILMFPKPAHPFNLAVLALGAVSIGGALLENEVYRSVIYSNLTDGMRYRFPMVAGLCLLFAVQKPGIKLIPCLLMFLLGCRYDFLHNRPSSGISWSEAVSKSSETTIPIDPPGWVAFVER